MHQTQGQVMLVVKNLPANAGDLRGLRFYPWGRKIPRSRKWQPTPVFLPGKFYGQRNLAGYSACGWKASDITEYTHRIERILPVEWGFLPAHTPDLILRSIIKNIFFSEFPNLSMFICVWIHHNATKGCLSYCASSSKPPFCILLYETGAGTLQTSFSREDRWSPIRLCQ